ncbi:MAG: hypothetical protein ACLT38_08875 [Akkermansia sp.]
MLTDPSSSRPLLPASDAPGAGRGGRALALMRSWFTAMPGETLSCIGCHERQNCAPPARAVMASRQKPAPIVPWYGPARTFSFMNEVQPVLDRHCIRCHTAESKAREGVPDFMTLEAVKGLPPRFRLLLEPAPLCAPQRPGGNYLGLAPTEFFADTSELYQLLKRPPWRGNAAGGLEPPGYVDGHERPLSGRMAGRAQ